jgi:membrane-bound lytic murein transglycosylase D
VDISGGYMKKYIIAAACLLLSATAPHIALREYRLQKICSVLNRATTSKNGLETVLNFDPAVKIPFFPDYKNKELFDSIDDLSICERPEVRKFMYAYITSGKPYIERSIIRSEKFLPIVKEIFSHNRDIPADLMYLPLLESGFDPNAVSRTKATGLWQFIAGTAKYFNLQNNEWLDERRSVEKSTESAIRHLRNLYKIHGSWEFALAAYNGGSGSINDAVKKNGSSDFWALVDKSAFSAETNEYVSRYAALLILYKHRDLFGIKRHFIDGEHTSLIVISGPANMKELAENAGISVESLQMYNPELKSDAIPVSDKPYYLRVPKKYARAVENAKNKIYIPGYKETISRL